MRRSVNLPRARLLAGSLARPVYLLALPLLCVLLLSCAHQPPVQQRIDSAWLQAQQRRGAPALGQTAPSPAIEAMARRIKEAHESEVERMRMALGLLVQEFAYDPAYARRQFTRSAAELFESRILGGCSDYALAGLALFRAMGHPCMLVVTVSSKWLARREINPLAVGYGHSFIEVMLDGRWHLADPNHFVLYDNYAPEEPFYPHKELFMARGYDFHALGLRSTKDAEAMLQRQSLLPKPRYQKPSMTPRVKVELDLPALFVGLGDILAGKNDFLALKRYTRALDFDPEYAPAFLARGRLHLRLGRTSQALQDLEQALGLAANAPESQTLQEALQLRDQARKALERRKSSQNAPEPAPRPGWSEDIREHAPATASPDIQRRERTEK